MRTFLVVIALCTSAAAAPTGVRTYDLASCRARVALLSERLRLATADGTRSAAHPRAGAYPVAKGDAGHGEPHITIDAMGMSGQPASSSVTIEGRGKRTRIDGSQLVADTIAAVKRRARRGDRIGLKIASWTPLPQLVPILVALGKGGPIQITVAMRGVPGLALPTKEAPRWAIERTTGTRTAVQLGELSRMAIGTCAAARDVFSPTRGGEGGHGTSLWVEDMPAAVARCGCNGLDVDALELAMLYVVSEAAQPGVGWLRARVTASGEIAITADDGGDLVAKLAPLSVSERERGVRLTSATATTPPSTGARPLTPAPAAPKLAAPVFSPAPAPPASSARDCGAPCQAAESFMNGKRWDFRKGAAMYRDACKPDYSGSVEACRLYAVAAFGTRGARLERTELLLLFSTTCARGDLAACAWGDRIVRGGENAPPQELAALLAACQKGDRAVCEPLYLSLAALAKDYQRARCEPAWWTLAESGCNQGDANACGLASAMLDVAEHHCTLPAGVKLTRESVMSALDRHCAAGDPGACIEAQPNNDDLWNRRCKAGEQFACQR